MEVDKGSVLIRTIAERVLYGDRAEISVFDRKGKLVRVQPSCVRGPDADLRRFCGDTGQRNSPLPNESDARWGVFAADSEFLGYTTLPRGLEVHGIGDDYVFGVVTNDLDVPEVHVYRISR